MAENYNNPSTTQSTNAPSNLRKIKKLVKRPLSHPLPSEQPFSAPRKIKKLVKRPLNQPLPPISSFNISSNSEDRDALDVSSGGTIESDFSQVAFNAPSSDDEINSMLDTPEASNNVPLPSTVVSPASTEPKFINDSDLDERHSVSFFSRFREGKLFTQKALVAIAFVGLFFGILVGKFLFSSSTVVRNGLSGVIANPEVPRGRARCGVAEKTQGCVLYIMNPQRQDLYARDFYDLASQLTGRQRFIIETGNMRYSNVRIAPGEIAQFNIPPLQ